MVEQSAYTAPERAAVRSRPTTAPQGLSEAEVGARVADGLTNESGERTSRTLREIVRANVLTRFNAILGSMLVVILVVGPIQDALFGIVLVSNALIGIVQELRAKRTLDRLAVLSAPRATVMRDGTPIEIAVEKVVLDDLVELRTGDQVPADGVVVASEGLEIDESLLTGESDPVDKEIGAEALSGSIVVAGHGRFQTTAVGAEAYARRLATEARRFGLVRSELVDGINKILVYVTWALAPTALLLAFSQFRAHEGWREALAGVVAGVVAMVPEGLVLLTSIAFAIAAITLARRRVLVQELPAVEGLARVDVVCLDKTGTLTEGVVEFDEVVVVDETVASVSDALGALAADEHGNATMLAIGAAFATPEGWERTDTVPFSSARKWSAASFAGRGSWVLGAPEMIFAESPDSAVRQRADELAAGGRRVLVVAHSDDGLDGDVLPAPLRAGALVLFEEKIRADASDTLRYFAEQGVQLKVISGDNPRTVAAVARRVGLSDGDDALDARTLPDDEQELADLLERHSVLGRVTPHQKRAIVAALQSRGHVVAMTGDGVNDALALKDADIGIAMGSGAPATRAVAQIILMDSKFSTLPGVVAEGRRVIANIERVSNLFVTKTVYAMLLAIAVGSVRWEYPFLPRHMTIISSLTIGIPAFFLALAPNRRRYVPGFVRRVLRFAVPAGFTAASATFAAYATAREAAGASLDESRTTATLTLLVIGLYILAVLARPITPWRAALVAGMIGLFVLAIAVPELREFYALALPRRSAVVGGFAVATVACLLLETGWVIAQRRSVPESRTPRLAWRSVPSTRSD